MVQTRFAEGRLNKLVIVLLLCDFFALCGVIRSFVGMSWRGEWCLAIFPRTGKRDKSTERIGWLRQFKKRPPNNFFPAGTISWRR